MMFEVNRAGRAATILALVALLIGCASKEEVQVLRERIADLETDHDVALLRWWPVAYAVGDGPEGVAFDGTSIWVANRLDDTVTKLRARDGFIQGTFPVGDGPKSVAFDGTSIWVTNNLDDTVTKLRASNGFNEGTFTVGGGPDGIAFDGASIWVANTGDDTVTKLQASDGLVQGTFSVGDGPVGIAFNGYRILVTNQFDGTLTVIRPSDGVVESSNAVLGPDAPGPIAFAGASIWVASSAVAHVRKLNHSSSHVSETFNVGTHPAAIAFDGHSIWVANSGSTSLSKLRASDGFYEGTYTLGSRTACYTYEGDCPLFGIAFDGSNIWVTSYAEDTVSKLRVK